jgi:hypothetical protein
MTQAMAGDGAYERHSDHQVRDARSHAAMIAAAAERIVADDAKGSLVLADYGCAQGGVSNALMRVAIERIRRTYPDVPISVIHNDVLANDWATLLKNLRDADGYLSVPGGPITPLISATSFYKPVTPRGLVDLGTSFAAIQWLGEPGPVNSGSALYFDQLEGTLRTDMARQAHADWTRFLELRADELAPGGRMVIDMMGMGEDGAAAGHDAWRHVRSIAEELVAEGLLEQERLDGYVIPVYERTLDEARLPFSQDVGQRLSLEHMSIADSPNPAAERYRETGDAPAFARGFVGFFRAFSEPSLRAGLDLTEGASDELYRRLEGRLIAEADDFAFTVHVLTAVYTRV